MSWEDGCMKADGMKEWKYESKDRKTVLSSPDWFDELPIQAVVMPDAMILPDLGQPASYYAILKSAHTHTHSWITRYTGYQFPDGKVGKQFSNLFFQNKNNWFTHIHMTDECIVIQTGNIVSLPPSRSHTLLSMIHGQEHFPGMRALIRLDRQNQQWNYHQMWWAVKEHTSYLTECSWLFGSLEQKPLFIFSLAATLSSNCVCVCVCVHARVCEWVFKEDGKAWVSTKADL